MPLVAGLETLARNDRSGRRGPALADAARAIAEGRPASVVIAATPHARALLAAGERVGRVGAAARVAADLEERLAAVRRRILGAMAYPLLVLAVAAAVVGIVLLTVVPQMTATLLDLGGDLPLVTRLVIRVADLLRSSALLGLIVVGALVIAIRRGVVAGRSDRSAGAPTSRLRGRLGRTLDIAVTFRVLATLTAHGVPLVDALGGAAAAVPGRVGTALADAAATVAAGGRLTSTRSLRLMLGAPELALLAVGEERGLLVEQFDRVAERRLDLLERRLERIGALAEPVLVLVVGTVVGTVVAALYLPTFRVFELL